MLENFPLQNANNAAVLKFYVCKIMSRNIKREGKKESVLTRAGDTMISFLCSQPLSPSSAGVEVS